MDLKCLYCFKLLKPDEYVIFKLKERKETFICYYTCFECYDKWRELFNDKLVKDPRKGENNGI